MKKLLLGFLGLSLFSFQSFSQATLCSISITPVDTTVCPNSPVEVIVVANLVNGNQSFNFNSSSIPPGWSAAGGTTFSTPCGPNPTGSAYYWASTAGSSVPQINTAAYDVSCGGIITFDMVYSEQGGPSPCEGPDQMNEGVALQYSTDGGVTWTTIEYYVPDGTITNTISTSTTSVAFGPTPFTTWSTFTVTIPPGAMTTTTQFKWFQPTSSGSAFDNWGIDNVLINASGAPCGANAVLQWSNGIGNQDTAIIIPSADTTFTIQVYDTAGNYMCESAPYTINVFDDNMTYSLVDTAYSYCPTTNPLVSITGLTGGVPPYSYNWSVPATTASVNLPTGGAEHDTIPYTVQITDQCGFVRNDQVVLVVNKLLNIDSLNMLPTPTCQNDGVVLAFVSGTQGIPLYIWTGPGTSTDFINGTVWTDRSAGWYYFSVTDNVCSDEDSIEVTILPPPIADMQLSVTSGCAPFNVTFTNTSQNATAYAWDFGNGNVYTVTSQSPITETYSNSAVIQMIAYDSYGCSDTTTATVTSSVCGCTDPTAINYNPLATVEDNSCVYPEPIFEVPNVFTPNGGGENDVFEIKAQYYTEIEYTIQNRWGQLVFEGKGLNPTWDGKSQNGKPVDEGVYFVLYTVKSINGDKDKSGQTFLQVFR